MKNLKIYGALKRFSKFKQITFSMPGHKRDKRFSPIFKTRRFDVTELTALEIEKACAMAEADVSAIYGARLTRFLSGGSTLGVLSMLNSVRHLGNKIIINRSAHKSVYNACKILNIEPITISGVVRSGVLYAPTFSAVQKAIDENGNVIGVLLTYPDYYGKTFDLKKISAFLKEKDKKFLIDGAHGAHLKFFGGVNPLDYADLCVFGAHKTLPTLTGGAFVLAKGVDLAEKLNESVNLFASTSPSYPILSSIEYGVKKFNGLSDRVKEKYTDLLSQLKVKIAKIGYTFIHKTDPLKLSIDFGGNGINSDTAEKVLISRGIHVEMNDGRYLLFMFSPFTSKRQFNKLYRACYYLYKKKRGQVENKNYSTQLHGEKVTEYLTAINGDAEVVSLSNSIGRVSADNIGVFPPCYPVVIAGERITEDNVKLLKGNVFGLLDGKVKVLKEKL